MLRYKLYRTVGHWSKISAYMGQARMYSNTQLAIVQTGNVYSQKSSDNVDYKDLGMQCCFHFKEVLTVS